MAIVQPKLNGVFCGLFLVDCQRKDKGYFVNKPFSNWTKICASLSNHHDCLQIADAMKSTTEKSDMRVNVMSSNALQKKIDENRHILRQMVRAVVLLGKQGIAFRGKIENITSTKNPGNCLALLKFYAETDTILFNHLYHTRLKMLYTCLLLRKMKLLIL